MGLFFKIHIFITVHCYLHLYVSFNFPLYFLENFRKSFRKKKKRSIIIKKETSVEQTNRHSRLILFFFLLSTLHLNIQNQCLNENLKKSNKRALQLKRTFSSMHLPVSGHAHAQSIFKNETQSLK